MNTDLFDAPAAATASSWPRLRRWASIDPRSWLHTLKARLAAGMLAVLFGGMALIAWRMGQVAEVQTLERARAAEHLDAQRTVDVMTRRIADMQRALRVVGEQLTPDNAQDPQRLSDFLEQRPVFRAMFGSLVVADASGRILLFMDMLGGRQTSTGIADRDYFRRAMAQGTAVISEPIISRLTNEPIIVFAQPLLAPSGPWGLLGGSLRLSSRDLLADLAESHGDDDSSLVVVTDDQGRILAHPLRARLAESLAHEPRLAQAHAQWVAAGRPLRRDAGAWSQPGEVVAMAGEPMSGWHVWRATAESAVLAPLSSARSAAFTESMVLALALSACMVALLAWQLRPLKQLERRAVGLLDGTVGHDPGDWPDAAGEIGQLSRTLRHVWAERTQVEAFNTQVLQKLSSVMAAAPVGLAFTRHQRFELISAEGCKLFGRAEHEVVGQLTQLIFASNEDYVSLAPLVAAAFAQGQPYVGEWQLLRADGGVFWARLRARPVAQGDPSAGTIWTIYDISDQVHSRRELEHAVLHDTLTGVLNRKGFERATAAVLTGRPSSLPASVVMLDLDRFKPINDSAGHAAGDAVLKAVAQVITANVRGTDTVARLGGDEFALILPRCDQPHAIAVAEKVRGAIRALVVPWEGKPLQVGASLGVAALSESHESTAEWLAEADAACYEAKHAGRDTVRVAAGGQQLRVVEGWRD